VVFKQKQKAGHSITAVALQQLRAAASRRWAPAQGKRVDLAHVEAWLVEQHARFNLRNIGVDPWQSKYMATRLRKAGLLVELVQFSGANLMGMAQMVLDVFNTGTIALYPEPVLLDELKRLCIVEKSYGMRLESPLGPTGHGDMATSLAIALLLVKPLVGPPLVPQLPWAGVGRDLYGPVWPADRSSGGAAGFGAEGEWGGDPFMGWTPHG
jgi:phage terminase large subunit-like protein